MAGAAIGASPGLANCDAKDGEASDVRPSRRAVIASLATLGLHARRSVADTPRIARVGWLTLGATTPSPLTLRWRRAFFDSLRELGWVEGKTIEIEWRIADGNVELLKRQARELVDANVDLIVCGNMVEAEALKAATSSIPIVVQVAVNPIERGLIASYAHPGGNITGPAWDQSPELTVKYPELLKEALASLVRLGGLYDAGYSGLEVYRRAIEAGARRLGLTMYHADVRIAADLEGAFADLVAHDVQAVFVYGSLLLQQNLSRIVQFCASRRLPDMYIVRNAVALGALMSYGVDIATLNRRAAVYVDKILRGAKAADLPVELPTKYELMLNLKTARARGLKLPQSLLLRADEVIE